MPDPTKRACERCIARKRRVRSAFNGEELRDSLTFDNVDSATMYIPSAEAAPQLEPLADTLQTSAKGEFGFYC